MPCDSIQLNNLEVGKMHPRLLALALAQLGALGIAQGASVTTFSLEGQRIVIRNGEMTVPAGFEGIADRVKVAYSRQVVMHSAKANGWKVRETRPNVFQVVK